MTASRRHPPARRLAERLGDESGFGLVETLVAMIVLVIGMVAAFQVFDAATRNTFRAEQSQVAINIAQRELEEIRNLDYDQVALSSTPVFTNDENDPRKRISDTRFDASNDGALFEMVRHGGSLDSGGTINCNSASSSPCINPGPEEFTSGDISGEIYRFVVWRNDPTCSPSLCAGSQDLKRVIVAVRLDHAPVSFDRPYIEVQSDFIDPDSSLTSELPSGNEVNVPQQFWLTDTSCDNTSRQPIVDTDPAPEGHSLHNTLGACTTGPQTGSTAGAPDLLEIEPPPDATPNDPNDPPILDYATDLEPAAGPDDDEGLQIVRQPENGCSYDGGSGGNPWERVHRWATPPISTYPVTSFVMTGSASLVLYAKSLGQAQHTGRVCTYLYKRVSETAGIATDTLIDSDAFSVGSWPTEWTRISKSLTFPQTTLGPTDRLVLALSIDPNGTPADTVQLLYDHPVYQSRLEVVTSTPVSE